MTKLITNMNPKKDSIKCVILQVSTIKDNQPKLLKHTWFYKLPYARDIFPPK
jgi:hypothetical protein